MELTELDTDLLPVGSHPLHMAAIRIDAGPLKELLTRSEVGVEVDVCDRHGRSPLLLALLHGRAECARLLVRHGARVARDRDTLDLLLLPAYAPLLRSLVAESPKKLPFPSGHLLPVAAAEGDAEVLGKALEVQEADVNHCDELGRTALHYACQNGHLTCVKLLLKWGASLFAVDSRLSTPMHLACGYGQLGVVQAIMECSSAGSPQSTEAAGGIPGHMTASLLNRQDVLGCMPVHVALHRKHYDIAAFLLHNFLCSIDMSLRDRDGHSLPSLLFAIRFSISSSFPYKMHTQLPCLSEQEATWLLHHAISEKDLELLWFAIGQGASVHSHDLMQHDPLLMSSRTGFLDACKALVAHGASVSTVDCTGLGPLHHAARGNHKETVAYLLSLQGIDVEGFYASYQEPLTTGVTEALVRVFVQSPSVPRPRNWVKWLCLVTPCADSTLYTSFAELVCPSDWVDILVDPSRYPVDQDQVLPFAATKLAESSRHAFIDICSSGEPYMYEQMLDMTKVPHRLWQSKHCSGKFHSHCQRRQVPVRAKYVRPRSLYTKLRRPQQRFLGPCRKQQSYYPLHAAVLSKKRWALHHILSCAADDSVRAKLVGLTDDCGRTVYELLLQCTEVFGDQLEVLPIPDGLRNQLQPLSLQAVLCYIICGRQSTRHTILKHVFGKQYQKKWRTPYDDDMWPHWCYVLKVNEYCRSAGIPRGTLCVEADKIRLASHILKLKNVDLNYLLRVAVECKSHWAITVLLKEGASPLALSDGKFALFHAIAKCDFGAVDLFMMQGFHFVVQQDEDKLHLLLSSALLTMARSGYWNKVLQILSLFPRLDTLPLMCACRNLFCTSLSAKGGQDVAAFLLRPLLSLLCHEVTNWLSLTETNRSAFISLLRCLQWSLGHSNNLGKDHCTFERLISFCVNRRAAMDSVLHQLCAAGMADEIQLMLGSDFSLLLWMKQDSPSLPPLLYAVISGHISVLNMCIENSKCTPLPASLYLGGILNVALSPHFHLTAQTRFQTNKFYSDKYFAHYILKETKLLPYLFGPVRDSAATIHTFVTTLTSHCQDFRALFCALEERFHHLILLVSLIHDLAPFKPLLKEMEQHLSSSLTDSSSKLFSSPLSFQMGDAIPHHTSEIHSVDPLQTMLEKVIASFFTKSQSYSPSTCQSVLDFAVSFATPQACQTGANEFENVLAQYAVHTPLTLANVAAAKGLWKVVEVSSQNITKFHQLQRSYSLKELHLGKNYYDALCMALRCSKKSVAKAIFNAFLQAIRSSKHCCQIWQHKLLHAAVRYDLVTYIEPILNIEGGYELLDTGMPLSTLAHYGSKEMLQLFIVLKQRAERNHHSDLINHISRLAAKYDRTELLEHLHSLVHSNVASTSKDPDTIWAQSFWYNVLLGAAEGGHERMALQALASIPERSLPRIRSHPEYIAVLHWCGYWGLADVLGCIPFAAGDLFVNNLGTWPCAWESAVANGHIGKLCSHVLEFPLLPNDLSAWLNSSYISITVGSISRPQATFVNSLLTGSFHRLMTNAARVRKSHGPAEHLYPPPSFRGSHTPSNLFYYGCWYGVVPVIEACIETLGKLAGHVLHFLHKNGTAIVHQVCRLRDSYPALQTLLKALFDADLLSTANDLDAYERSPSDLAALVGNEESIKALIQSEPHSTGRSKENLLQYAVMSRNPSAVRTVCKALGKEASILSLRNNKDGVCPLQFAFAMGYYKEASELMTIAAVRQKVLVQKAKLNVTKAAKSAFGWFGHIMKRNELAMKEGIPEDTHMNFSLLNIRKCKNLQCILSCALKAGHVSVVLSALEVSYGLVLDKEVLIDALVNPRIFNFMKARDFIDSDALTTVTSGTLKICRALQNGQATAAVQVTETLLLSKVTLDVEMLFETACQMNNSYFLRFLVNSKLLHNVSKAKLSNGVLTAAALTQLETGLFLLTELGIELNEVDRTIPLAPVSNALFCSTLSYFYILNAFFQSTIQRSSLLPTLWLTRNWTSMELEYIQKYCRKQANCNPWQLSTTIKLHVEWNSFFKVLGATMDSCMISTTPLWVEAFVFSHAVVGQLCSSMRQFPAVATITLSCNLQPTAPTTVVSGDHLHILLHYSPNGSLILLPDCFVSEPMCAEEIKCIAPPKHDLLKDSNFAESIARSISKTFSNQVCVSVQLDQTLSLQDSNSFNRYFVFVWLLLDDCHLAFQLVVKRPSVRYSFVLSNRNFPLPSVKSTWRLFMDKVTIKISVVSGNSGLNVSFQQRILEVEICIGSDVHEWIKDSYESLLRVISTCLCEMELEHYKRFTLNFFYKIFLPKLSKITKCNLCSQMLSLFVAWTKDAIVSLADASIMCLSSLKQFGKVKKVLLTFIGMIKLTTHKATALSSVRQHLNNGFSIVLNNFDPTTLQLLQNGSFQLSINLHDTNCRTLNNLLIHLMQTCLPLTRGISNLGNRVVAPHACFIDWSNSPGLIYPVLGCKKAIAFCLMDYTGQVFTSIGGCKIEVRVTDSNGWQYVSVISSTDEVVPTSEHLVFGPALSSVEWTPQTCGVHTVGILVNGLHIGGSPVKAFVSSAGGAKEWGPFCAGSCGHRQTTADVPFVFVVSHPHGHCEPSTAPTVILSDQNRRAFKPIRAPLSEKFKCDPELPSQHSQFSSPDHMSVLSSPSPLRQAKLKAHAFSEKPLHYLSVCSMLGGARDWAHHHDGSHVQVLTLGIALQGRKMQCASVPLGNGHFRVSFNCSISGTFKLLTACVSCQAVMCIHWADQIQPLPLQCYVVAGPISLACSILSRDVSFRQFERSFGPYTAGVPFVLYLRARDALCNPHTAGGSNFRVFIENGEKPTTASTGTIVVDEIRTTNSFCACARRDISCEVRHESGGVYSLACRAYRAGLLRLVGVTRDETRALGEVAISSGPPYAPRCLLVLNQRTATVNEPFACLVHAYDEFGNPCSAGTSTVGVAATCNNQIAAVARATRKEGGSHVVLISFTPRARGTVSLDVTVNGARVPSCPVLLDVAPHGKAFPENLEVLLAHLRANHAFGSTPTITIRRDNILGSAMEALNPYAFHQVVRVRFGDEPGIDAGGIAREFFHLLSLELVNPHYNLFHSVNGLYKPSPSSDVNPNHLLYFTFFGKILAKAICDGHQLAVRFTSSVYKFLLGVPCSLDDLKAENLPLYMSLKEILHCDTQEQLTELSMNFSVDTAHFGKIETVELEKDGSKKQVTMENKEQFVSKVCHWYLTGCINQQLSSMKQGFNLLVPHTLLVCFSAYELEIIISGLRTIDVDVLQQRTKYTGYSKESPVIVWLWELLFAFTEEEKSHFLQFTTGCSCLPCDVMGKWELHIKNCPYDPTLLPTASTCFNALSLPEYPSKEILKQKLMLAITYGAEAFLYH